MLPNHNLELFKQRHSVFPIRGNATWANIDCVVLAVPENFGNCLSDIGLGSKKGWTLFDGAQHCQV